MQSSNVTIANLNEADRPASVRLRRDIALQMAAMIESQPKDIIVGDPMPSIHLKHFPEPEPISHDPSWLDMPNPRRILTPKEKAARKAKRKAAAAAKRLRRR